MGKSGLCVAKERRAHCDSGFKRQVTKCLRFYASIGVKDFLPLYLKAQPIHMW